MSGNPVHYNNRDNMKMSSDAPPQPEGYNAQHYGGYNPPPPGAYNAQPYGGYNAPASGAYNAQPYGGYNPPPQGAYSAQPYGTYNPPPGPYMPPSQDGGYGNPSYALAPSVNSGSAGYGQPTAAYTDDEFPQPKAAVTDQMFGSSFSDKAIRRAFIRKVYLILFAQLLVTFGFICLFIFVEPLKKWVQNNLWFYLLAYGLFLVLYITLVCCPGVRRKSPGNWVCLSLFTLAFSYMTATISSFHDTGIVLMAAGITAAVCLAISIFAIQTKIDFTMCSGLLFALVMVLFFFGFACMITYYAWGYSRIMNCVYGGIAALVFGLFLIYDTQQVMGGRKYEISPEEYIYGALQLYIDIVYIFIIILGFMGNK